MELTKTPDGETHSKEYRVVILRNGPYLVKGNLPINRVRVIYDHNDTPVEYETVDEYPATAGRSLCRCGNSHKKPFCDGSHALVGFSGRETSDRSHYFHQARKMIGRNLILFDQQDLCMGIGFCHQAGGIWNLMRFTDEPSKRKKAIEIAWNCPSGRLVVADRDTEEVFEPDTTPQISIIEEERDSVDCPIWLRGGIALESQDGFEYEVRHRVTLCSCGRSRNKPFCDGRHNFA